MGTIIHRHDWEWGKSAIDEAYVYHQDRCTGGTAFIGTVVERVKNRYQEQVNLDGTVGARRNPMNKDEFKKYIDDLRKDVDEDVLRLTEDLKEHIHRYYENQRGEIKMAY